MFKAWKSRQLNVAVCMSGGDPVVPAFFACQPTGLPASLQKPTTKIKYEPTRRKARALDTLHITLFGREYTFAQAIRITACYDPPGYGNRSPFREIQLAFNAITEQHGFDDRQ